jgi:hypothetical protein
MSSSPRNPVRTQLVYQKMKYYRGNKIAQETSFLHAQACSKLTRQYFQGAIRFGMIVVGTWTKQQCIGFAPVAALAIAIADWGKNTFLL